MPLSDQSFVKFCIRLSPIFVIVRVSECLLVIESRNLPCHFLFVCLSVLVAVDCHWQMFPANGLQIMTSLTWKERVTRSAEALTSSSSPVSSILDNFANSEMECVRKRVCQVQ